MKAIELCPYCKNTPLNDRKGAVTCGGHACKRKRQAELSRGYRQDDLGEAICAAKSCNVKFQKKSPKNKLCGSRACKREYDADEKRNGRDAIDPMTELRNRFLQLPVGFR